MLLREEVEIRLADRPVGVAEAEGRGQGLVDANEAAGGVLEVDGVGEVIHKRVEQVSFLGQRLLGPLALAGHEASPRPVQGLAQAADDRADQHKEDQADHVADGQDLKG